MIELITQNPVLGILISLGTFMIGKKVNDRLKHPVFNPILIAIALSIIILKIFNIDYEVYRQQNTALTFFLGPATVVLAVPLYKNISVLKSNLTAILIGVTVGCIASISSVVILGRILGANNEILLSMSPKAVTTPIAMEISSVLGGIPSLTAGLVGITGVFGACFAPEILKLFRIRDKVAIGIAIGTSTHALGTTRAFQEGEVEGSMSSLSIALAGLITALIAPYVVLFIK